MNTIPKILIVRLGAMGDVLHAIPAVAALHASYGVVEIHWVIDPRWAPLLSPSLVDRIYLADTRAWSKQPFSSATLRSIGDLRRQLREHEFDAVVDLQGSIRSAVISRFARSRCVIGNADPREKPARIFYSRRIATHTAHVVEQAAEIASAAANAALIPTATPLPIDHEAEVWFESKFAGAENIAVIAPGAGWGAKRWPPERYGQVAAGLAANGLAADGLRVLINCGPGEEDMAQVVIAAAGNGVEAVSTSLPQLIVLLRHAKIFIGGDTGPLHLAAALNVPVVGLYGPTDPARNGPYATRSIVLRHANSRRDHTRHAATEVGLMAIPAVAALDAAHTLLQQSKNGLQNVSGETPSMTLIQNF
jgi:heptosyltransferase-1